MLSPVKQQDEWDRPYIVRYIDIISDKEIETVKKLAKPRVSNFSVLVLVCRQESCRCVSEHKLAPLTSGGVGGQSCEAGWYDADTHMHVCLRPDKSCPWLHSYAGPPSPTLSQECWRQLHTGSAKGKTQPGATTFRSYYFTPLGVSSTFSSVFKLDWGPLLMLAKFGSQNAEDQFRLLKDFVCKIYLEVVPPPKEPLK